MRKKYLFVALAILVLGSTAAGGAWYWHRTHDQMGIARAAMTRGDLHSAQLALRSLVRNDPQNTEGHFRLGATQLALGDAVAAERELRFAQAGGWDAHAIMPLMTRAYLAQSRFAELLKEFPVEGLPSERAGPLLGARALAHLGLKENDAAATDIAAAERLAPEDFDILLAAARIAIVRNDGSAETKVDRALAVNPRSVDALLIKGMLRYGSRDYPAALATYDAAVAITPNAPAPRVERAKTLLAMGQDEKAREDVTAALAMDARNPTANYLQAVLLMRAKDWVSADAALAKIEPVLNRFPRGEYFLSLVKMNLGQGEQAIDAASRYVAHEPRDAAGYKLLARIHAGAGRPQQAIEVLSRATAAGLTDAEMLELLGGVYARTGQTALAAQTLDRATTLAGDNAGALARIAVLRLGAGDPSGAEREFIRSLEIAPDQAQTGEQLVVAALAAGDVDRAVAALERLKRQPKADPAKVSNLTGLVRLAQLNYDGARAAFEAAIKADPNAVGVRLNLARVLALQNRPAEAETQLNEVLRKDPANAVALTSLSRMLIAQRRTDRLMELLEAARKVAPGNAGLTVALAALLADNGDAPRGYALLNQMPKDQAELPGVLALRARLQIALGQQREAQDTYRRILTAEPRNLDAVRRLAELLAQAGDTVGAKQVIRQGLDAMPGNLQLLETYVAADYRVGGLDAALESARQLAKEPAQLPAARMLTGGMYMSLKRFADAAAAYQAELSANPSTQLAVATAVALNVAGRQADAARLLRDWIDRHPDDLGATQTLSGLELQNHQLDDAERDLNAILAKQPNNAVALNNLAWIYQQRKDPRARDLSRKAFLLAPSPQTADTLAWILVGEDDATTALTLLRQATRGMPGDLAMRYHLAVALNATGQRDDAIALLTTLAKTEGDFDDKPAARKLLDELGGPKQ
jgi:putative PEP-CTERM system TPR-repeat lipoprotein